MATNSDTPHFETLNRLVPVAGLDVLDIGCGKGWLTRTLRQNGARPIGLECTSSQIDAARDKDPQHAQDYIDGVAQSLPFEDQRFDLAIFSFSLHHVPVDSMLAAFAEVHRVLKPGGLLYVLEPTANGSMYELDRLIDDEAEVRKAAQTALQNAPGFNHLQSESYEVSYVYDSLEDFVTEMVGIDPKRSTAASDNAAAIEAAFNRFGEPVEGGGRSFAQPNTVAVLQKT